MTTTFGKLPIGATFDFPSPKTYYGGPYKKISTRKYQEIESGMIHTVGSVSAKVEKLDSANPSSKIPVGKFIPARLNPDGTVTFKVYKKRATRKKTSARKRSAKKRTTKRKR